MIGLVLAAGTGRRLHPYTEDLPKTLVPLGAPADPSDPDEALTPLDVILGNFAKVGVTDVAVVVGHAAEAVRERKRTLERRYGVSLELLHNEHALRWNNCYSLWCARQWLSGQDVLMANGDTVHPVSVEHVLIDGMADSSLLLAVDTTKDLGAEEMKVTVPDKRSVTRITKLMDPAEAYGEYIGVALLRAEVGPALTGALEATWRRDPSLYYEDGFQEFIDRGDFTIDVAPIGDVPWVEIDDTADLARATSVVAAIREAQR
ncbi:sugar phosphate nucleotidyltransferase [Actinopolymorpha sp. B11F2]|uniref:phosphocholine cytidylyltransferase family protein n=1 Tax=Actinopolymorpha sp. B11F2 TaxID=3160862 RepID=UPI0032E43F30